MFYLGFFRVEKKTRAAARAFFFWGFLGAQQKYLWTYYGIFTTGCWDRAATGNNPENYDTRGARKHGGGGSEQEARSSDMLYI